MRNAVPSIEGTPASDTVTSTGLYEKMISDPGATPPAVGTTWTDPEAKAAPKAVVNLKELRRGMEYENSLETVPFAVTVAFCPVGPENCIEPPIAVSVGLTRTTCVVQPLPLAKCGRVGPVEPVLT